MVKKRLAILAAEDIEKKKKDEAEKNTKNVTAKDVADKFGVQLTTNDTGRKTTPGVNPVNNVVNATKQKVQALYQQKVADLVSRATAYAKQGSDYTLDLANSIINGAITSPGKGNTGKLDIDAIHDMTKANSEISRALSESGIFNIREIATNPVYAHLATQDYRTSLLPVLQDELTASLEADKANDAAVAEYESALRTLRADYTKQAETAAQWKDFFSLVGEEATLEDKLRAAGIATGETYDRSVFAGMDKYSAYAKKKELDDWYASLDAAALSAAPVVEEPEAPKYDSKTAGIQDEISTLEKYLNAHQTLEELTAYARSNPDFATASVYTAPDYSNLSAWEQFLMPQIGGAYADNALYTYINTGDVDPHFSQSTESADYYKRWEELGYDYMLDQDKEIWNVLRTMDPAKADAYLQALSQIYLLPTRAQGYRSWDETVATNGLTAVPAWIGSVGRGIDNILSVPQQLAEAWAGVDNPYSEAFDSLNRQGYTRGAQIGAIQEAEMPEWMKTVAGYAYQGVSGAADNTARLLATGMNPTAALIAAGLQSASGSLHESSERDDVSGAAKIVKAIGAGAIEVGTEKIGLDALFDKGKSGALQYLKGVVLSEMGEETLNALSEPALEAVVAYLFDHEAEIKSGPEFFKDLTDTAITTAISSLLMGGGGAINQTITNRQTGKAVTEQGDPERMVEIAKSMDPNSEVYQIAAEIETSTKKGQKMPLGKLGRLTQEMGKVLGEQYADLTNGVMNDAITERLIELGSDPEAARRNADVIRKIVSGIKLTVRDRLAVAWNGAADLVTKEILGQTKEADAVKKDAAPEEPPEGLKNYSVGNDINQLQISSRKNAASRQTQQEDIGTRLVEAGYTDEEAKKLAPIIQKQYLEENLTKEERALIEGDGRAEQVLNELEFEQREGQIALNKENADVLMSIAENMPEDSTSREMAKKIQDALNNRDRKSMTFHEIAALSSEMLKEVSKGNANVIKRVLDMAIENRLVEMGETRGAARRNARTIRRIYLKESVSLADRMAIRELGVAANEILKEFDKETEFKKKGIVPENKEPYYPEWVQKMHATAKEAVGETVKKQLEYRQALTSKKNVSTTVKEAVKNSAGKVRKGKNGEAAGNLNSARIAYDDGTGSGEGDIQRFEESEDGKLLMVIEGKDGEAKVDIGSFTQADGEGTAGLLESIKDINDNLHKVSAEEASAMLSSYKAAGGDVARFVESYETLYLRGYSDVANDTNLPATDLDGTLAKIAVESGRRQAEADEQQRKARASAYKAVEAPTAGWLGVVNSDSQVKGSGDLEGLSEALESMTESQRVTAETAIELGKAIGVNVVLYESDKKNMSRIANGSFDQSTHTVYLDVNASLGSAQDIKTQKDKGTLGYAIMRTMGHELTHYLEAGSPEMYAKYKRAVLDALKASGEDTALLIRQKIDRALANGKKLTYNGAVAEVIADASEYMLQDSKFTTRMDNSLRGKVKTFVQNFMGKVKEIFSNLTSAHRESAALREMVDGVYRYTGQLQELWDASLQEVLDRSVIRSHVGEETEETSPEGKHAAQGKHAAKGTGEGLHPEQYMADIVEDSKNLNAEEKRFSIRDSNGEEIILSAKELEENKKTVSSMNYVSAANGNSYVNLDGAAYRKAVQGYFDGVGRTFENPTIGAVRITTSGLKHLTRYKSKLKSALVPCVKDVIENGVLIDIDDNHDMRGEPTVVLAAPVTLDEKGYYMGVAVRQANNLDKLYHIHEAALIEQEKGDHPATKTEPLEAEPSPDGHPSIYSILDSIRKYNRESDVFEDEEESVQYSDRDLPTDITVRDYLAEMEPTDRMNETEKILLKRYKETLGKLREAEKNAAEQDEIIKTATGDELTKAKNRWQIYRKQADRYARELARAERAEGFAGMLATGQQLVDKYMTGGYTRIADASDELDAEIKGIEKKLKAIGATLQGAEQSQKDAHARGLFNQTELNAAAKQLKDSYASRMSVKEISNRLALAYGEIYANNGAEGAKRFADAAKELAQDIVYSSKYRYRSDTLTLIAEEVPVISLTETDKQEIKNAGLTISQYKRGIAPFVKVAEGASDLSSYISNAEAYGGQLANILGTDTEGNLAMALYNVIQAERSNEQAGTFEGMTEGESISAVMVDIMSANLPMTTDSSTIEYLRKEMLKQAGTSQTAAKAVEGAIQSAKTATRKASSLWHKAVQEVQLSEDVIEYYRALDEQRRLMELAEQKKTMSEQLKTDAAKKIHEQVEKQRTEYREREQRAREYRKTREGVDKLRRSIGRKVKRLNTLRVRETDQKHVPQELQHVADLVMQTFTESSLGRLAFPEGKMNSLARTYRELKLLENDATYYWDDEIDTDITNLQALGEAYSALRNREGDVPSRFSLEGVELETEILQGVDAIVSNVMQMIDSTNDAFLTQRSETFSEFANKTGEKLRTHDDHKVYKGWRGKLQNMLDELIVKGNMTPIYFFEHLQNQEMLDVFNELREGQNLYAQIVAEGKAFMESTRAKHNYGAWVNDGKLTMKTGQGHTIELTREEAAEIYAIAKREAANKLYQTEHLLYGGFQYKNIAEKLNEDGKTQQKNTPHQLDKADISRIGEWLTAEQKAYADELVGFLSTTMADYGNQASMDMYGYKKFTEQYYIPFHTSAEQRFLKGDEGPQGENAGTGRVKNSGFTKKLQHKANQTLLVGGISDTVADHIHKMAAYAAMVQPIENMKRLMNHQVLENDGTSNTIRALIGQKYGQASQDYLMQLLKDANGATMSDHRASGLTDKLVGAFKRGAVMASASVVLQQPTAMARAMAYINPKHFANNPFYRPSKGTWDELMKYSGTAVIKDMGKFDVGMGLTATQYILDENLSAIEAYRRLKDESKTKAGKAAYDRFMNWLTAAPGVADQWTWGLIWKAVKDEQAELHPEMDKSSEAFLNLCGARFDDVIDHTQVYDSVLTRSDLMRSTNALHKMATSFMSEPTLSLNMLWDALTGKHTGKQRGAIIGGVVASQVLAGALAALVQAWNDDDDERNWLEKYADRATGNVLDNLNPLGMIPYVSDIISIFEGYDVERPDMSVITDIYNYSKKFVSSFENGGPTWKETENFVGTLANLLGIPAKNISREVRRTWNMITKTDWSAPNAFGVGQAMKENLLWYGDSKTTYYQRITTALIRGETQLAEDYKAYMLASQGVDEDKLTQGIRTAYKEAYEKGGIDKDTAIAFLLENNLVTGDTEEKRKQSAFQYVDKWEEGTDGYSAYNTLKDAYAAINFSEIEKAWKELTNNGYTDKQVKEQSRTLLKKLVQDGSITTGQATQLLKKWCPYAKDSDNTDKPKEWANGK